MTRFDIPAILIPEHMALHARRHPEKPALICNDVVLSWGAFERRQNRIAHALAALGVGRGDKVGILADNSSDAVCAYFGTLKAGAAVASLPTIVTADSLATMIADCGAKVLIVSDAYLERIDSIRAELTVDAAAFIAIGGAGPGWRTFDDWFAAAREDAPQIRIEPDDDACLIYSSGTTGVPKGIVLTHYCRLNHAYLMSSEQHFNTDSVFIVTTALHSNTAWTLLLCAFLFGASTVIMPKFEAEEWCRLVERWHGSATVMVPAQYQVILDSPAAQTRDLSSLKTLATVGSHMREGIKRRMLDAFPCGYYEVYGLTEGFATIVRPEDLPAKIVSVGRAMLGNDIRIIDHAGKELPQGEAGEIVGHSPILMKGYHNSPEQTEAAIWREPGSGRTFLRSGDIGRLDEDGFLFLLDRKKDMIVSGGYNVFPADIERVLGAHPDVYDLCVIGIPHERWGETPLALIVPTSDAAPDLDAMRTWANERLGKHQRIASIEIRDELPRNPAGKVMKADLRKPYWQGQT
ncbi:MAG: class I adenylate-forming enzyme family protein [Proteobacteria bacterium]|nr:class I adenylate-forming enzyme family protein [Pseudomonadota bacterium]MDA1058848.1 class I adenylate-forming enzyme family protein [Pseudomonadota bacterium]